MSHPPRKAAPPILNSVSSTDLQIEGRAADDLEHVGGGGLLLERFTQLVEQARVLDGDDGLSGEVLDQLDLLIGERRTSWR